MASITRWRTAENRDQLRNPTLVSSGLPLYRLSRVRQRPPNEKIGDGGGFFSTVRVPLLSGGGAGVGRGGVSRASHKSGVRFRPFITRKR